MAQAYRCRICGWVLTLGVPTVSMTRQVSEVLSQELGRPIVYHDWSPAAADRSLRERAERIWQEKADAYFEATKNLRTLPDLCPGCGAAHSWNISLGSE